MKRISTLMVYLFLLSGCTIPIPKPSNTEMLMDDAPYEWTYQKSDIAWDIMNEKSVH